MNDRTLLELAARHAASKNFDDIPSNSHEQLEKLDRKLRERAAKVLDSAFLLFTDTSCPYGEKQRFTDIEYCTGTWSGERLVSITNDGQYFQERTRRWLRLDTIADDAYKKIVDKGFYVMKRILIGAYDIRSSSDGGTTWCEPTRSEKLEVITGLYTMPGRHILPEDLGDDRSSYDHFYDGPFALERFDPSEYLGCNSHVFSMDELDANGFITPPSLQRYPTPTKLFAAMNAALDDFEDLLCEAA